MNAPAIRYVEPEALGFESQRVERTFTFPTRVTPRHNWHTAVALLGRGDCLAPWFVEDDVTWYTPNVSPQDGDLVAVDIEFRRVSEDTGATAHL